MSNINAVITGVGMYLPEYRLTNDELSKMVDTNDEWIMSHMGIKERRILKDKDKASAFMGAEAVKDLLRKTGTKPEEIDLVICATVAPDYFFPATGIIIADMAGLTNAYAFDLHAACSGFLYAITTASKFIKAGTEKKIIVVGAEKMSSITDYTCGMNQFEGGYPVIAAVFSDAKNRDFEDLSFSNMYTDIAIQPQEITISLEPGWTWFSYPYPVSKTLDEALVGFTPMSGDIIVSQSGGTTSFVNGRWRGALTQFTPGLGYMYYSSRSESAPLVFDLSSSRARVKP